MVAGLLGARLLPYVGVAEAARPRGGGAVPGDAREPRADAGLGVPQRVVAAGPPERAPRLGGVAAPPVNGVRAGVVNPTPFQH